MAKKQQIFPLEMVLTISATEYANLLGCGIGGLCVYDAIGVYGISRDNFQKTIPKNAEVVVGYIINTAATRLFLHEQHYGTALIPKEQARKEITDEKLAGFYNQTL